MAQCLACEYLGHSDELAGRACRGVHQCVHACFLTEMCSPDLAASEAMEDDIVGSERQRETRSMSRRMQVAVDCSDPERLAEFWCHVLGYRVADPPDDHVTWAAFSEAEGSRPDERWCVIIDPDRKGPNLLFHSVPEQKQAKNRVHLDVWVDQPDPSVPRHTLVEAEAERLRALGATDIRTRDDDGDFYMVMHDPEHNEFCIA